VTTQLAGPQSFEVVVDGGATMAAADRAALVAFQQQVARLQRAVSGALQTANEMKSRLALIKRALYETPSADPRLLDQAAEYERRLNQTLVALRGDTVLAARNENVPPSINDRVGTASRPKSCSRS
jgi:chromosome segregation ATPase